MVDQAMAMAGNIVGGVAGYETGKFNRKAARTQAIEEERAGAAEESRIREAARAAIGAQVAAQGSNGFQQGTGSAIDALMQSQIAAAFDGLQVRSQAAARARARRVEGDIAYAAGSNQLVQGMLGAASTGYRMQQDWASARVGSTPMPQPTGGGYASGGTAASGYRTSFVGD